MEPNIFKETIQFALEKEKEAVAFYTHCSTLAKHDAMKRAFLEMAGEEKSHVRMLENFKPEHVERVALKTIPNLKISDYLVDTEFRSDMNYKELLILAMKREESAYALYSHFAQEGGDPGIVKLFQILAQEELKHKNRLEKEYDDHVLQQN